jgi:hypothetical protein
MPKTYKTIMIDEETHARLTGTLEAAGLRVRGVTSGGQRPLGLKALLDLAEKHGREFAALCKARAVNTIYRDPVASSKKQSRG